MKPIKIFMIMVAMCALFSFSTNPVCSAEDFDKSKSESKELYTSDNLGYWFDDLQWFGFAFDDWSFGSISEESGTTFHHERLLLLLRHNKGNLQPYVGIAPGLLISQEGFELDLGKPSILLGFSCSF